jgi:tetratricopeptide (TPR) repeat protein
MNDQLWTEVESAYLDVVRFPEPHRTEYLHRTYSDRLVVRQEVESLLRYKDAADHLTPAAVVAVTAEMLQEASRDLSGTLVGGKYRIRECIGRGGQAEVYLADHIALDTPFALKRAEPFLSSAPEFRRRFLEEARRAVVLRHDNIARVHDVLESDDGLFVVMEHIDGENLRRRLERMGRPFRVDEFLPIAIQCASAIAAAHEKRIVHLDVKPENIMLTSTDQVKVCDFGIAHRLSTAPSNDTGTADWPFAGTPAYMAPEVILNHPFDERADLFSLGTVFYEMLSGRNPFIADTVVTTTARVVSDVPPPISNPDLDSRLQRVIARLLAKNPRDRFATANELVEELKAVDRARSRFEDLAGGLREAVSEHRWVAALAATLLVCVVAAGPLWLYREPIGKWGGWIPALPQKKVVVVLPIRVIGDNTSQFYFDGLTEALTAKLTELPFSSLLRIVPLSEARTLKTPSEARKNFGANLAIGGSVSKVGETFRVVLVLSDTGEAKQLRTRTVSAAQVDSVRVQNQIVEAAASLLELELGPQERRALTVQSPPANGAYEFYLKGRGYLANRGTDNFAKALDSFRQAIVLDQNFGLAYAGLGDTYWAQYDNANRDSRLVDRSYEACTTAVKLDPNRAEGHICLGTIDLGTGHYEAAVEDFQHALELDRSNDAAYRSLGRAYERLNNWEAAEAIYLKAIEVRPDYWYNYVWLAQFYLFARSQQQDAVVLYKKAVALAPENPSAHAFLGASYILVGQYQDAIAECQAAIALKPNRSAYINLGVAHFDLRQYAEAAAVFQQAVDLDPSYYKAAGHLARALYFTQRHNEALQAYGKAIGLAEEALKLNPLDPDAHIMMSRYYAMTGNRDAAMSHLQLALNLRPKDSDFQEIAAVVHNQFGDRTAAMNFLQQAIAGGYSLTDIEAEAELDNLRADPRFRALVGKPKP